MLPLLAPWVELVWSQPNCEVCGGDCVLASDSDLKVGCYNYNVQSRSGGSSSGTVAGLPRSAKYGIIIGVGIPGLLCFIGLGCFICGRIRVYARRRHPNTQLSTSSAPHQSVVLMGLDGPTIESFPKILLESIASRCGMRSSTRLGLRPPLHLEELRTCTTASTIQELVPPSSQAEIASKEADLHTGSPAEVIPSPNSPSKEAKQTEVHEREEDTTKGVALDATKLEAAPKDPYKGNEAFSNFEIILATLPISTKDIPRERVQPLPQP
nr:hypothetical protein CFP56_27076 [Quercus suber]